MKSQSSEVPEKTSKTFSPRFAFRFSNAYAGWKTTLSHGENPVSKSSGASGHLC